jgi:hypothetical protein
MTEDDWARCIQPQTMLEFLRDTGRASERKLRLFAVECCRRAARLDPRAAETFLPTAEAWANGQVDAVELRRVLEAAHVPFLLSLGIAERTPAEVAEWAVEEAISLAYDAGLSPEVREFHKLLDCVLPDFDQPHCQAAAQEERTAQAADLRDLLGPLPFRPVAFSPAWRTPTVLALATALYQERRFGDLPILADALEEAGCDNEEILGHLRQQGGGHVLGCWALDRVLGKE